MAFVNYFKEQQTMNDLDIISEADIWDDKFGRGSVFYISDKRIANDLSLKTGTTLDKMFKMPIKKLEKMTFTKSLKPLKNPIVVTSKDPSLTIYMKGSNGKNYEISGSRSFLNSLFNKKVENTFVDRDSPESIEIIQCAGLYLKNNNIFEECKTFQFSYQKGLLDREDVKESFIKKSKEWGDEVAGILNRNKDWKDRTAVSRLVSFLIEELNPEETDLLKLKQHFVAWWKLACLLSGSYKFAKEAKLTDIISSDFNIISEKIGQYYTAERSNAHIKKLTENNVKSNTADVVICNTFPDELIATVAGMGSDYKIDDATGVVSSGKIKWIQVSLKKVEESSQTGKVGAYLVKTLDLPTVNQLIGSYVTKKNTNRNFSEGVEPVELYENIISDFFGDAWEKTKQLGSVVLDKLKSILDNVWGSIVSMYNSVRDVLFQKQSLPSDIMSTFKELEDSLEGMDDSEIEQVLTEASETIADRAEKILGSVTLRKKLISQVNKYLDETVRVTNATPGVMTSIVKMPNNQFDIKTMDDMKRVLANVIAFVAIRKAAETFAVGKTNKMKLDGLCNGITDVYKEAVFGSTPLPLYKVYGSNGKNDGAWYFLGSPEEYKKNMMDKLTSTSSSKMNVMINKIVPIANNGYYVVAVYLMNGIDGDGEKTYINFRADSSGGFAFNLEGTNQTTETKIIETLNRLEN